MYRYRDYFPRRILRQCGVSPDKALAEAQDSRFAGKDRQEEIGKSMARIREEFRRALAGKSGPVPTLEELEIDRRILSAFYDMDILQERDRAAFPSDYKIGSPARDGAVAEERVSIEVPESDEPREEISPKADGADEPQRGRTL